MAEMETAAVMEQDAPKDSSAPPAKDPAPAPRTDTTRMEQLLRRLEEESALQTRLAKKRLFWGRLSALFVGVMAAAVVFTVGSVLPRARWVLDAANTALFDIHNLSWQLQQADIPAILENLDQTLTEGRASLNEASEAVQAISTIDFASLNTAILDLKRLLENPLGSLFGRS